MCTHVGRTDCFAYRYLAWPDLRPRQAPCTHPPAHTQVSQTLAHAHMRTCMRTCACAFACTGTRVITRACAGRCERTRTSVRTIIWALAQTITRGFPGTHMQMHSHTQEATRLHTPSTRSEHQCASSACVESAAGVRDRAGRPKADTRPRHHVRANSQPRSRK